MTVEVFIGILVLSATATSLGIELIKNLFDAFKWKYQPVIIAVVTAFIIGFVEVLIYALKGNMEYNWLVVVYAACMGLVNVVGSTVGYDTVKKFLLALVGKVE